jgi:hypothetical protein
MQRATDKLFSLLFNILLIAIILFSSLQFVRSYNTIFFIAWIFEMMSCIIARSKDDLSFRDVICFEVWRVAHVSICNRPAL